MRVIDDADPALRAVQRAAQPKRRRADHDHDAAGGHGTGEIGCAADQHLAAQAQQLLRAAEARRTAGRQQDGPKTGNRSGHGFTILEGMNCRLGLARKADVPKLASMARSLVEAGLPHSWDEGRIRGCLNNQDCVVLVARDGKRVVGFAMMEFLEARAHLVLLAVEPGYQGRGIGWALLEWLETTARTAGTFLIHLEVRAGNLAARRFYAKAGFAEAGTRRGYYNGSEDAVKMARNLAVT